MNFDDNFKGWSILSDLILYSGSNYFVLKLITWLSLSSNCILTKSIDKNNFRKTVKTIGNISIND